VILSSHARTSATLFYHMPLINDFFPVRQSHMLSYLRLVETCLMECAMGRVS
jgi:hypothetical protein